MWSEQLDFDSVSGGLVPAAEGVNQTVARVESGKSFYGSAAILSVWD